MAAEVILPQVAMRRCYNHVIESAESTRRLVTGSSDTSFQLNERQCQFLAQELVKTSAFLEHEGYSSKLDQAAPRTSLRHLCAAVQRAELLVKKCCCKDLESWVVAAMMLVEIQEDFMAIILDIHMWKMFWKCAITWASREEKAEAMKIMDEDYHQLFKELRKESHALRQAAVEDKSTFISKISRIVNFYGSTNELEYRRAVYVQSWLTGNASQQSDTELRRYGSMHTMGRGGCGTVFKVRWLGVECALKILGVQDAKEATALKGLLHPNIIRFFHYWEDPPNKPQSHILMELMPEDLGTHMENRLKSMPTSSKLQVGKDVNMPFSLAVAIDIMYQIAQAMHYMHDVKHLTHRDLKPSNILVKKRPDAGLGCVVDDEGYLDIKLADFGLVKPYENTSTAHGHTLNTGTRLYQAPEVFDKDLVQERHYLPKADVWSFGITCAAILTGKHPYFEYADVESRLITQSRVSKNGLRPTLPEHCPQYLEFCIRSCWELSPQGRPTFASICELLRHARFLSLGVTNLDESKLFFAYTTRFGQVTSLPRSSSGARFSQFMQSQFSALKNSLKYITFGVPTVSKIEKDVPSAAFLQGDPDSTGDEESLQEASAYHAASLADLRNSRKNVESATAHDNDTPVAPTHAQHSVQTPVQFTLPESGGAVHLPPPSQRNQWTVPKFPVMCLSDPVSDTGGVLHQTWNLQQSHPVQKPLLPTRWFEGKSAEPERPKFQRASNSPAALARWSSGESGITLPKPSREFHKSHVASSSSSRNNKGSREQDGYHIPTAPAGYYRDDDIEPSPQTLVVAVSGMKGAVNHFAKVLIADINKHPVEMEYLKQSILQEMHSEVDRPNHWKFLVQAFICKRLIEGFSAPNGYFGLEDFQADRMSTLASFADFTKFKDQLAASIPMLMDLDAPDASFLGRFCFKKFKSICGKVGIDPGIDLPLLIYQEEWYSVAQGRHPKTVFYQNFLKAAMSVWLLHRLAHSFDQKVEMLSYEKGFTFQRELMESVIPGGYGIPGGYEVGNEENDVNIEVCFLVIPGFQVNRSVVKCEVYLRDKVSLAQMETSVEKTHMRQSSNSKTPVKSLSHKTPALKPHILEMTVHDNSSPGGVQTCECSESFSSDSDDPGPRPLRPKIGDLVRSAREVKAETLFWNDDRESFSPGIQGTGTQSEGKSRNERESLAETHPGNYKRDFTIRIPTPRLRGPPYVALQPLLTRPTELSERRSLANVRQPPSG